MNMPGIEGSKQVSVSELLRMAKEHGASDLQLTVGVPPIIKVNGILMKVGTENLYPIDTERFVRELIPTEVQLQRYLEEGDLDFSVSLPRIGRFRINVFMRADPWRPPYAWSIPACPSRRCWEFPGGAGHASVQQGSWSLSQGPQAVANPPRCHASSISSTEPETAIS